MSYRSTPHSTTGLSPAELFLSRPIHTLLALVHPSTQARVEQNQSTQKKYYYRSHTREREFMPEESVFVRSHKSQEWSKGTLVKPQGSKTWVVNINNRKYLAHIDQLRHDYTDNHQQLTNLEGTINMSYYGNIDICKRPAETSPLTVPDNSEIPSTGVDEGEEEAPTVANTQVEKELPMDTTTPSDTPAVEHDNKSSMNVLRNPTRNRKKSIRLNL